MILLIQPTIASTPAHDKIQLLNALDGTQSGSEETNAGDLVAESVRAAGHADIALVSADELSDTLVSAGDVPSAKIFNILHYDSDTTDTIDVLKLTGSQIEQTLERATSRTPDKFEGFLQVAGLTVQVSTSSPMGKRVKVSTPDGALSPTTTYTVATTRSIAEGGLGYFIIWNHQNIAVTTDTTMHDALRTYLGSTRTLPGITDNRIVVSP